MRSPVAVRQVRGAVDEASPPVMSSWTPAGCRRFRLVRERQERFVRSESRQSGSLRDRDSSAGSTPGATVYKVSRVIRSPRIRVRFTAAGSEKPAWIDPPTS